MRILHTYLLKELFRFLFLSLCVLTFVMLLGNLVKFVNLIIVKGVDVYGILKLFFYLVFYLFTYTLPVACLFAILLSLGRFSSDGEITALRVSGLNLLRIVFPILVIGIILSLFLVIVNDKVIPLSRFAFRETIFELSVKNPTSVLEPGTFIDSFEGYTIFIYSIKEDKLSGVRIYELQGENRPARTIVAKRGEFVPLAEKGLIKLKLIDGSLDEPDPRNPYNFYKVRFKNYFMTLNLLKDTDLSKLKKKPKDMNVRELKKEIQRLDSLGIDTNVLLTQLYKRGSLAFSAFVFILIGIPLALLVRYRAKSANLGIAFLTIIIYYLLSLGFEALSMEGHLRPIISVWLPNIIFFLIGLLGLYKVCAS